MEAPLQVVRLEPGRTADASVIWLHGLGADGHDFEPVVPELRLPPDHGIRFLFPHAPIRPVSINAGMEMRAWYDIGEQGLERRVDETGIRASAAAVQQLLDEEIASGIESARIVLAGFSQGGAIALHLGLRYPSRLAGILALSTYLPLADSLPEEAADNQNDVPVWIGHGSFDPMVPEAYGSSAAETLRGAGYPVEYQTYPMQHAVCAEEIADISRWLQARLPAV